MTKRIEFLSLNKKAPPDGYWDQALLKDIFADKQFDTMPRDGSVVVIPGAYQADYIDQINEHLQKLKWVVLFITSDEESKFPIEKIKHDNIVIYVQYPKQGRHDQYKKLPLGYTSETRKNLVHVYHHYNDFFFAGQITHKRREQCFEALRKGNNLVGEIHISKGFAEGLEAEEYMEAMATAKAAPCPAGPVSADTFRVYEALESGTIPIADNISISGDKDYWNYLFNNKVWFPTINDYEDLRGYIEDQVKNYPAGNNRVFAKWIAYKDYLRVSIIEDIERLSRQSIPPHEITVVIPVSPIKSHPSTEILEQTISSIRFHLPDSPIFITFDGVRPEQEEKRQDYNLFIQEALFKCNTTWNATPLIFEEHTHQVGMARTILPLIKSPMLLYVEQDTPLVTDEPIEWGYLKLNILDGTANVIRFHFEAMIPKEHKHLMLAKLHKLIKTVQWSQRPHLASTAFYDRMLQDNFSPNAKCFIEDVIHGKVYNSYLRYGDLAWDQWRLFIYAPEKNLKRSLHLDGRAGEVKFDDNQTF